jgi:Tfp pilus assembly protein PilV
MLAVVRLRNEQRRTETGTSLADILIAIVLLGIGVAGLLNVWGTSISLSLNGRETSTIAAIAVSAGEAVRDQNRNPYVNCASTGSYVPTVGLGTAPGYTITVTEVKSWDGDSFNGTCLDNTATYGTFARLQQITVKVTSAKDARVARTAVVVKRSPT